MNNHISTYCTDLSLNTLFKKRTYIFNLFYRSNNYLTFFFYNHIWFFLSPYISFNNIITNIFINKLYKNKSKSIFFSKQNTIYKDYRFLSYKRFKYIPFFYKKVLTFPLLTKNLKKKQYNNKYTTHPLFIESYSKLFNSTKLRVVTPLIRLEHFNFLPIPAVLFKTFFKSKNFTIIKNSHKRFRFLNLITNLTKKIKIYNIKDKSFLKTSKFIKLNYKENKKKKFHLLPRQHIFLNTKTRLNFNNTKSTRDVLISYIVSMYKKGLDFNQLQSFTPFNKQYNIKESWNSNFSYNRSLLTLSFLFKRRSKTRSKLNTPLHRISRDLTQLFHYKIIMQECLLLKKKVFSAFQSNFNIRISHILRQLRKNVKFSKLLKKKTTKRYKKKYNYQLAPFRMYNLVIKRASIAIYTALNSYRFNKIKRFKNYNTFRYWSIFNRKLTINFLLHKNNKNSLVSKKWSNKFLKLESKYLNPRQLVSHESKNNKNSFVSLLQNLVKIKKRRTVSARIGLYKREIRKLPKKFKMFRPQINFMKYNKPLNVIKPSTIKVWDNFKLLKKFQKLPPFFCKKFNIKKPNKNLRVFCLSSKPLYSYKYNYFLSYKFRVKFEKTKKKRLKKKFITKSFYSWQSTLKNICFYNIKSFLKNQSFGSENIQYTRNKSSFQNLSLFTSTSDNLSKSFKNQIIQKNFNSSFVQSLNYLQFWKNLFFKTSLLQTLNQDFNLFNTQRYKVNLIKSYYLKDLTFFKKSILNKFQNLFSTKKSFKISKHRLESKSYYLFSKYSRSFISSSAGFLFTNCNFLYHKKFQLDSLKISHLNRQRYSFFYKNDIKKFYLNRSGSLTFLQNLDKNTFLKNTSIYNRLYLRKNHYTYDSISSVFLKNTNNLSLDSFFNNYNTHKKFINTYGLLNSNFIHKDLTPRLWEPRIKRIRFKPGYQRIWRKAREGINFSLKLNFRYQHRLTHRLAKLRFLKHKCTTRIYDLTLSKVLLNTRFVCDLNSSKLLIDNSLVYVNGILALNINLLLYVGDFIQIAISLKYYILYRWLVNWNFNQRARLLKLSFYKNKVKHDLAKQKSNILPDWIFKIGSRQIDIPKYTEVDYFTLSIFIIYEPLSVNEFNPLLFLDDRSYILNMYNWKFIN